MKSDRAYAVSFGASDKYSVPFDGSIEEFRNSDEFKLSGMRSMTMSRRNFPRQT